MSSRRLGLGVLVGRAMTAVIAVAACAGTAFAGPMSDADRAKIESVMERFAQAAVKGDAKACLDLTDLSDEHFAHEMRAWVKDLARVTPTAMTLSIVDPNPPAKDGEQAAKDEQAVLAPDVTGDEAVVEMSTTWTVPRPATSDGKPAPELSRTVSFPAKFTREPETGAWRYAGEAWRTLELVPKAEDGKPQVERGVRVRFFAGFDEVAERIVQVLPDVREHVHEGFGLTVPRVQEVKLYPSMRHLQLSIYPGYIDGLGGWNEPGEAIKLLARPSTGKLELQVLLSHEYGHLATFEMGPKASDMPWWALEGVAELATEKYVGGSRDADAAVRSWSRRGQLQAWEAIADFHNTPPKLMRHVYKQGQHMMRFISDEGGREGRNRFLRVLANGGTLDEAARAGVKMSFAELDAKWRIAITETLQDADASRGEQSKDKPGGEGVAPATGTPPAKE